MVSLKLQAGPGLGFMVESAVVKVLLQPLNSRVCAGVGSAGGGWAGSGLFTAGAVSAALTIIVSDGSHSPGDPRDEVQWQDAPELGGDAMGCCSCAGAAVCAQAEGDKVLPVWAVVSEAVPSEEQLEPVQWLQLCC